MGSLVLLVLLKSVFRFVLPFSITKRVIVGCPSHFNEDNYNQHGDQKAVSVCEWDKPNNGDKENCFVLI